MVTGDLSCRLDGRIAVVTGAARGIGAETARLFATLGCRALVLIDTDEPGLKAVAADVEEAAEVLALALDVGDESAVDRAAAAVDDRFGHCDVLVNNAGVLEFSPLEDTSLASWTRTMDSNLTGHFLCTRAFGALMLRGGSGSIVNVTSIAGAFPKAGAGAYSVSKAGQAMLARQVAVEWGPRGVRANVVSPGMIMTAMAGDLYERDGVTVRRAAMVPVQRIGQPDDVARLIAFLASDASSYISGQEIHVDGGVTEAIVRMLPHPGVVADPLPAAPS